MGVWRRALCFAFFFFCFFRFGFGSGLFVFVVCLFVAFCYVCFVLFGLKLLKNVYSSKGLQKRGWFDFLLVLNQSQGNFFGFGSSLLFVFCRQYFLGDVELGSKFLGWEKSTEA